MPSQVHFLAVSARGKRIVEEEEERVGGREEEPKGGLGGTRVGK
jgi:hypothetical protein